MRILPSRLVLDWKRLSRDLEQFSNEWNTASHRTVPPSLPAKAGNPGLRAEKQEVALVLPHVLSKSPWITRPSRVMTTYRILLQVATVNKNTAFASGRFIAKPKQSKGRLLEVCSPGSPRLRLAMTKHKNTCTGCPFAKWCAASLE
jgi:hypothetical protein